MQLLSGGDVSSGELVDELLTNQVKHHTDPAQTAVDAGWWWVLYLFLICAFIPPVYNYTFPTPRRVLVVRGDNKVVVKEEDALLTGSVPVTTAPVNVSNLKLATVFSANP